MKMGSLYEQPRVDRLESNTRVDPPGFAHIAIPSSCSTEPRRFGTVAARSGDNEAKAVEVEGGERRQRRQGARR